MEVFRRIEEEEEEEEEEEDGEGVMLMERRMNSMSLRLKRSFFMEGVTTEEGTN